MMFIKALWDKLMDRLFAWKVIDTIRYYYSDNGQNKFTISATFYIGRNRMRKIELDLDTRFMNSFPPTNHPFYHSFCVPFLKKTGAFSGTDESVITMVKTLADSERDEAINLLGAHAQKSNPQPDPTKFVSTVEGNVITFPNQKKDSTESETK